MIKKLIFAVLIALPLSVFAQKFGVVDVETVITAMPEYTTVQTQMNDASKKYEDEYAKLNDELNKKAQELDELEKDAATPASIKERRVQEVQELYQKAQQFAATAREDLQRQQQQLMAPIEQKLQDAIKSVGQEGGFTFIFHKSMALYEGSDVVDATPLVKTKLGIK